MLVDPFSEVTLQISLWVQASPVLLVALLLSNVPIVHFYIPLADSNIEFLELFQKKCRTYLFSLAVNLISSNKLLGQYVLYSSKLLANERPLEGRPVTGPAIP